jgi:hypothetical protein
MKSTGEKVEMVELSQVAEWNHKMEVTLERNLDDSTKC